MMWVRMACGVCVRGEVGSRWRRARLGAWVSKRSVAGFTMRLAELSPVWLLGAVGGVVGPFSTTGGLPYFNQTRRQGRDLEKSRAQKYIHTLVSTFERSLIL